MQYFALFFVGHILHCGYDLIGRYALTSSISCCVTALLHHAIGQLLTRFVFNTFAIRFCKVNENICGL